MSVYSGFAKRNAEEFYDLLTFKLIQLLSEKIIAVNMLDGKFHYSPKVFGLGTLDRNEVPIKLEQYETLAWLKKIMKIQRTLAGLEK